MLPDLLIFLMARLPLSATYTFPLRSTAKLFGLENVAVDKSPSENPIPLPDNGLIALSASTDHEPAHREKMVMFQCCFWK